MAFFENRLKHVPTGPSKILYINWPLVILVIAVSSVGILMLYSISGGNFDVWAKRQMQVGIVGLVLMFMVGMVPIWVWRSMAGVAYIAAFILLIFVEFKGVVGMGAQRWIDIGPIRLQPSGDRKSVV